MKIKIIHKNLLEIGTVTVTSEATGFDAYRLYDRMTGRLWMGTSMVDHYVTIDQGTSGLLYVHALVIPEGHDLAGALEWEYSVNASTWYDAASWTQAGSDMIFKTTGGELCRYWRLKMTGLTTIPKAGEIFMSPVLELDATPQYGLSRGLQSNIERIESPGGVVHRFKKGEARKSLSYTLPRITSSEKDDLEELAQTCADGKSFVIVDHEGEAMFCELIGDLVFNEIGNGLFSCSMDVLEAL